MSLPDLLTRDEIRTRLLLVFPEGTPQRTNVINPVAASTVFAALYVGAVVGTDRWLGPKHVYRMTDEQAQKTDDAARDFYVSELKSSKGEIPGIRWYRDNTREGIRDDTLREGLIMLGAVAERPGVATTANLPRYALTSAFASLFDPALDDDALEAAIQNWQKGALNAGALMRLKVNRRGAGQSADRILVTFPNGETRHLKPGPSSEITKAVVEVFAVKFLADPVVLSISESGNKVVSRDEELSREIGLNIKVDKDLPDLILADMGADHPLLVFVEVVHSDGPISDRRKDALTKLVEEAGFPIEHVAFVTAYRDRSLAPFKKTVPSLAWGTYAWFEAEPDQLVVFSESVQRLSGRP